MTVKADDNLLPYITTDVVAGTLEIGTKQNTNINPTQAIEYHLTVKSLSSVTLAGFGNIDADKLSSDTLQVKLTGSGDIHIGELTGENLNMNLTGFGNVSIDSAEVAKPTIDLSGSGDIKIGSLKATALALTISGVGNASVSGTTSSETIKLTGSGNYQGAICNLNEAPSSSAGLAMPRLGATDLDLRVTWQRQCVVHGDHASPRRTALERSNLWANTNNEPHFCSIKSPAGFSARTNNFKRERRLEAFSTPGSTRSLTPMEQGVVHAVIVFHT